MFNKSKKPGTKIVPQEGSVSGSKMAKTGWSRPVMIHAVLAVVHLVQALTQFGLTASRTPVTLPVTRTSLIVNSSAPPWSQSVSFNVDTSFPRVQVMYMTASFLLITAVAHFITGLGYKYDMIWTFNDDPDVFISKRMFKSSTLRWIEYSITSTIMIVAILLICAVTDIYAIINGALCNFAMILFGHFSDEFRFQAISGHSSKTNAYFSWAVGAVVGLGPWISIWMSFAYSGVSSTSVGVIVASATFTTMSFFFSFAAASAYYTYYSPIKYTSLTDETRTWEEYVYPLLSATSKTLLSWLVYGALIQATV